MILQHFIRPHEVINNIYSTDFNFLNLLHCSVFGRDELIVTDVRLKKNSLNKPPCAHYYKPSPWWSSSCILLWMCARRSSVLVVQVYGLCIIIILILWRKKLHRRVAIIDRYTCLYKHVIRRYRTHRLNFEVHRWLFLIMDYLMCRYCSNNNIISIYNMYMSLQASLFRFSVMIYYP